MKRTFFLIIFTLFLISLFYYYSKSKPLIKTSNSTPTPQAIPNPSVEVKKEVVPIPAIPTPNATPAVTKKRVKTLLPLVDTSNMNEEVKEFSVLKNKAILLIPAKQAIRRSHHQPSAALIAAGKALGELKTFILKYPDHQEIQEKARSFYEQCAATDSILNSIRSLCLHNRITLAKNRGEEFDTSSYPAEIKKVILRPGQ